MIFLSLAYFKALTERPENIEHWHYRPSILNSSVTNRNVRGQFTAYCDV